MSYPGSFTGFEVRKKEVKGFYIYIVKEKVSFLVLKYKIQKQSWIHLLKASIDFVTVIIRTL